MHPRHHPVSRAWLPVMFGLFLLLSACGFQPMYKEAESDNARCSLKQLEFMHERTALAVQLKQHLAQRFLPEAGSDYRLSFKLGELQERLAIEPDARATLAKLTMTVDVSILSPDDRVLFTKRLQTVNSYNIVQSPFAAQSNEDDARRRALHSLAREIHHELIMHFRQQPLPACNFEEIKA